MHLLGQNQNILVQLCVRLQQVDLVIDQFIVFFFSRSKNLLFIELVLLYLIEILMFLRHELLLQLQNLIVS